MDWMNGKPLEYSMGDISVVLQNPVGSHYKQEMYWKGTVQVNDMGNFQY